MTKKIEQMKIHKINKCCLMFSMLFLSANVTAADNSLENLSEKQRIERLERMLSSDLLREQTQTIQSLREEITVLRDHIEQQEHEVESMKQRQRNLYLDMDRRINNVESGGGRRVSTSAPLPPPTSNSRKVVPVVIAKNDNGREAYAKAYALINEGQYEQSITAFKDFKKNYPQSNYADNAQYWLGEASSALRDYKMALTEFEQLIAQYPDSPKNPGARLKIGYAYYGLKNWSAARDSLQQTITMYPDTTVAKKANDRLQRMKREGH